MDTFTYGQVVEHPHPAFPNLYTFIAPIGITGFWLCPRAKCATGADGGSLDFGYGWAYWLRGAWGLGND